MEMLSTEGTKSSKPRQRGALSFAQTLHDVTYDAIHLIRGGSRCDARFLGQLLRKLFFLHADHRNSEGISRDDKCRRICFAKSL